MAENSAVGGGLTFVNKGLVGVRPPDATSLPTMKGKVRSTTTDGCLRSWVPTNVGGRRVSRPTGLARDSSLWIEYGPRDCGSCREAQTASRYIRTFALPRQWRWQTVLI